MASHLGEGWDNIAYETRGEVILRFSKEPDPLVRAARVEREAQLLRVVACLSPLPVPEPLFIRADQGCLAYRKLPGLPLVDVPLAERLAHTASISRALGAFLGALHAVPVDHLRHLVDTDDQPLAGWRTDAAELYRKTLNSVPAAHQASIQAFFDRAPPEESETLVFSHNDLGIEHVLVDPATWTVTGIIDWGDAAIVDPAYDFGLIYRDLGPTALEAALSAYPGDPKLTPGLRERAIFYARCSVFEDLAYGLETGRQRYLNNSLAALAWLFPA